jgi:hypothetical protein
MWQLLKTLPLKKFDIGTLPKGVYIVSGIIDTKKMVTKIGLQ